jgi:hypothetical protein
LYHQGRRERRKEGVEVFFKVLTRTNFEKFGYSWYNVIMSIHGGSYKLTIS